MFYADLNDIASNSDGYHSGSGSSDTTGTSLPARTCGPNTVNCNGEWGQGLLNDKISDWSDSNEGIPDANLQNSTGYSNAFCNAIVGICQKEDASRADFDANCPAERQANYVVKDGDNANYSSTCAQQPISGCGLYYMWGNTNPVSSIAHVCNTSHMDKCWSQGLCTTVGGVWTLDEQLGGFYCSDSPSCPDSSLYNSEQGGMCMSCGSESSCTSTTYLNDGCDDCSKIKDQESCTGGGGFYGTSASSTATIGENTAGYKNKEGKTCFCSWDDSKKTCSSTIPIT